jgi:hypothetical protein
MKDMLAHTHPPDFILTAACIVVGSLVIFTGLFAQSSIRTSYLMAKGWFNRFEVTLDGWPDVILSSALFLTGVGACLLALFGPRVAKVVVLTWMWFP